MFWKEFISPMLSINHVVGTFLALLIVSLPVHSQSYSIVMDSGETFTGLKYESFDDSTLTMSIMEIELGQHGHRIKRKRIHNFPIDSILGIENPKSGSILKPAVIPTDFSLIRGVSMGVVGGYVGMFVGAGIGYSIGTLFLSGEELIGPVFGGGAVGMVVTASAGLIYFSKHKIGRPPKYHDFSNIPIVEKRELVQKIFLKNKL